jgi:hypothetical protein
VHESHEPRVRVEMERIGTDYTGQKRGMNL